MKWKTLSSEYLFKDSWFTARKDTCQRPDGTIVSPYYVLEYPEWVTALALTKDNQAILVKQYRHAFGEIGIETPGGCVDVSDIDFEAAIKREMLEETGYVFDNAVYLGITSSNPSTNSNLMHMFLLQGGQKVAEQSLDAFEEIEVELYSIEELIGLIKENKIVQSMHVNTIMRGLMHLNRLVWI